MDIPGYIGRKNEVTIEYYLKQCFWEIVHLTRLKSRYSDQRKIFDNFRNIFRKYLEISKGIFICS